MSIFSSAFYHDVLIVGSGAAGLTMALHLVPRVRVAIVSKNALADGSTFYAQGGIAAVLDDADSVEGHVADTISAGAGLCNTSVVRFVAEHAPVAIRMLVDYGVSFTTALTSKGETILHLTREGGHSHRRIVHVADATGVAVQTTLIERIRMAKNVVLLEHHIIIDLLRESLSMGRLGRCVGVYALDRRSGQVRLVRARVVVLATGGASKVYLYTSNPDSSTGDGIAMAWRAGCRVANLEFCQFHPTCLYHPQAKSFLITEAVRGEGGSLRLPNGQVFMDSYHPRAELAPRDIVARAIDNEMKKSGLDCVYLDISHKPADFVVSHFPTVHAKCLEFGLDMTQQQIPVVPAAHYTCGGIITNIAGRTDVPNLYAIGECAFTGLHGANRMASNSLLECFVFGAAAAADVLSQLPDIQAPPTLPSWDESCVTDSDEEVVVSHNWDELRRFMWDYVGIVRSTKRLERAQRRCELLSAEISEYYRSFRVTDDLIELRNLTLVAKLIIQSALRRKESRGLHYTIDFPGLDTIASPQNTVLVPDNFSSARPVI